MAHSSDGGHTATPEAPPGAEALLDELFAPVEQVARRTERALKPVQIGTVTFVGRGVVRVRGLPDAQSEELLRFPNRLLGMAFNLDPGEIGVVMLDESEQLNAGDEVRRTGRVLDVAVGEELLGRVVDPVGRPVDGRGPLRTVSRRPCERDSPSIMDRLPVTVPLQTGLKVVDALIPIGRGQRELILGDRQTGKTAIAIDTILNQRDQDVVCIYCAIGQRNAAVAKVIAELREREVLDDCVVVVADGDSTPGMQFVAPFAATTIGEYFMEEGRDVLVVYDDLASHARAYRELSLLLRRPPGREAYPGDIFYLHSRLLERATHLREEHGGGSLTALPIAQTEAQNVAAYIPTNLISITDGQIYLSPDLAQKGILPAVEVGRSVSRVGGKTQLPAYRAVAGDLRLSYSQFEELEAFSRFSGQLDEETRTSLEHGRRVREIFKQSQYETLTVPEQIAVLTAVTAGAFDKLPVGVMLEAEADVRAAVIERHPEICERIVAGEKLSDEDQSAMLETARQVLKPYATGEDGDGQGDRQEKED